MLVIFHTEDLVEKVVAGQWREAFHYVRNFAPITQSSKEADFLSSLFLEHLMAISGFADGNIMVAGIVCDWFRRIYRHPVLDKTTSTPSSPPSLPMSSSCAHSTSGTYTFVRGLRYLHICSTDQSTDVAHAYFLVLLLLQELPGLATGQEQGSRDGRGDGQQDNRAQGQDALPAWPERPVRRNAL